MWRRFILSQKTFLSLASQEIAGNRSIAIVFNFVFFLTKMEGK
jgi:hypothetical protein